MTLVKLPCHLDLQYLLWLNSIGCTRSSSSPLDQPPKYKASDRLKPYPIK